jgi:hypothetical protein
VFRLDRHFYLAHKQTEAALILACGEVDVTSSSPRQHFADEPEFEQRRPREPAQSNRAVQQSHRDEWDNGSGTNACFDAICLILRNIDNTNNGLYAWFGAIYEIIGASDASDADFKSEDITKEAEEESVEDVEVAWTTVKNNLVDDTTSNASLACPDKVMVRVLPWKREFSNLRRINDVEPRVTDTSDNPKVTSAIIGLPKHTDSYKVRRFEGRQCTPRWWSGSTV